MGSCRQYICTKPFHTPGYIHLALRLRRSWWVLWWHMNAVRFLNTFSLAASLLQTRVYELGCQVETNTGAPVTPPMLAEAQLETIRPQLQSEETGGRSSCWRPLWLQRHAHDWHSSDNEDSMRTRTRAHSFHCVHPAYKLKQSSVITQPLNHFLFVFVCFPVRL